MEEISDKYLGHKDLRIRDIVFDITSILFLCQPGRHVLVSYTDMTPSLGIL